METKKLNKLMSFCFSLPAVILFTVFFVYPCLSSFYYAFTDWDGLSQNLRFIGLNNFLEMVQDVRIRASIGNTLYYAIVNTLSINFVSLLLALVLNGNSRIIKPLKILFYIPALLSGIVVAFSFNYIFEPNIGVLNALLKLIGLGALQQDWLGNSNFSMNSILMVSLWQWMGYHSIIYLANLKQIPLELYESADIESAEPYPILLSWND
jgi:multiple sugar transport system permease protein/raffinose/stachyose/melibiose transport system permease protein